MTVKGLYDLGWEEYLWWACMIWALNGVCEGPVWFRLRTVSVSDLRCCWLCSAWWVGHNLPPKMIKGFIFINATSDGCVPLANSLTQVRKEETFLQCISPLKHLHRGKNGTLLSSQPIQKCDHWPGQAITFLITVTKWNAVYIILHLCKVT